MGGHSTHTTTNVTKNNNSTTNQTNDNNQEHTQTFWQNNHVNTEVAGNTVEGRTAVINGGGNAGLQCFGMAAGDPRCKLQNLLVSVPVVRVQDMRRAIVLI